MIKLLNEIQDDLGKIAEDLKKRNIDDVVNGLHYLHAYIETRKRDFAAEPAETERAAETVGA